MIIGLIREKCYEVTVRFHFFFRYCYDSCNPTLAYWPCINYIVFVIVSVTAVVIIVVVVVEFRAYRF